MKVKPLRPIFSAFGRLLAAVAFASLLPAPSAQAGSDAPDYVTQTPARQKSVVKWHKKIVEKVLVTCGVAEPAAIYVEPGYLETSGPAPMLVYRQGPPPRLRRVSQSEGEEKHVSAPASKPSPSPAPAHVEPSPAPAPASLPTTPIAPAPASPTDSEPALLPESGAPANLNRTQEMLSYFQRQRAENHPYNGVPAPLGGEVPGTAPDEQSFLQAPLTSDQQPVVPQSRATYRVTP